MSLPLISVVITTFNYAHTVGSAIASALRQDYPNLEVLVCDNASTDDTEAVVARFRSDPRLRYIRNPENIGMNPNHNKGLRESRGTYLSFLSADDFLMPHFISKSYRFLQERPDIDVLYTATYFVDEKERYIGTRQMSGQPLTAYAGGRNEFGGLLSEGCYMCFPTMLMKRTLFDQFGELDTTFKAADYEIIVRWAAGGVRFAYDPEPTCSVRLHATQQSAIANYGAWGGELRELANLVRKFVPEHGALIGGYEHAISRHLEGLHHNAVTTNAVQLEPDAAAAIDEARTILTRALERNDREHSVRRPTVVVMAGHPGLLTDTLRSLTAQTHEDWEAIVVQPPGPSLAPLTASLDQRGRIRAAYLTVASGEAVALNTALRIANGDVFAFLRAGDRFEAGHLERLLGAFREGADVLLAPVKLFVERPVSSPVDRELLTASTTVYDDGAIERIGLGPTTPLCALAFTRRAYDRAGPFNTTLPQFPHWELLLRMSAQSPVAMVASAVEMNVLLGITDPTVSAESLPFLQAVHQGYPAGPEITAARVQYLRELQLAFSSGIPDSAGALIDLHRAIAGTSRAIITGAS